MKANAVPLLALFEKKMRIEVPLFQRQYVWRMAEHWEPLWEDIARKFTEYLEGRRDAPVHFLGAMVLDQLQTPSTHVEKRQVIDGQQRLTTLQIFLAAFRDFCREQECEDIAKEFDSYTFNKGMMADPKVDRFKVWPTQLDRPQFEDVVGLGSRAAIEKKHPVVRQKYARQDAPRPRMVEAYLYFSDQLRLYFLGTSQDAALAGHMPLGDRIEEVFQALKGALQVVAIDLEKDDDAQVIFETLNARGEPLLPVDLLRNYIFLRAARMNEPTEDLYERYWRGFDNEFWRTEVRQGRLNRPRSDLFMQHFLASRKTEDIPIKHLFVEYRHWITKAAPFATVTAELETLSTQREHFRSIVQPKPGDLSYRLATFLEAFDIRTAYPLLLTLFDADISGAAWKEVTTILESYLLRRAVCGWTTKDYNRVFLTLTRTLRTQGPTAANLRGALSTMTGESRTWPTDAQFSESWMNNNAYDLKNPKLTYILRRIGEAHLSHLHEDVTVNGPLTVEHLLPQNWVEHWPLANGESGLTGEALWNGSPDDLRVAASLRRNVLLQTFGNLTILTQALNSGVSNSAWANKKAAILQVSLLPINQQLHDYAIWDEAAILKRGKDLLNVARKIWPAPGD